MDKFYKEMLQNLGTGIIELEIEEDCPTKRLEAIINTIVKSLSEVKERVLKRGFKNTAVFTGVYRTVNDKHWVSDVVAGAGFGILSTELAYWLFPKINGLLTGKEKRTATMVMPYYQNKGFGIGLVQNF
ncbi:hypothetical protein SAMN05660909_05620 [Chitinophaga terrae (ex Kim and Jung 2007)]|uniref:Uncharacterized protein n=1 Tax=Chitinophaga terrae (ex Kim and Jung 2007) TaxID=408074 RepID=A0A1H4GT92_9BACT|nr:MULTISPECIES: hypothetical protein [Chitinophagaceae]MBZ4187705.1 hypothetical protein [Niabella beijingensis]GEP93672.1 hypothetical protein CTE07_53170 [Chitinophaga terrae (ex Kim and Jung 2007)]SEB11852.1 hypothetical protein SAMN05660909_05620 [Chitinophaga terrae (ex Kim and Jung 2007)]